MHCGEHQSIVDANTFTEVQTLLQRNGRSGGRTVRNKQGALLRGLLRCASCNCGMNHAYSKKGNRQYRYYVCHRAQTRGWKSCPAPSIPAGEVERFVVNEIKYVGRDQSIIRETLAQAQRKAEEQIKQLKAERSDLHGQLCEEHTEICRLAIECRGDPLLADAHDRVRNAERRVTEIDEELAAFTSTLVDEVEVAAVMKDFDGVWECLTSSEQARVIGLLVERVSYDSKDGSISITFRPSGIKSIAGELAKRTEEAA